MTNSILTCGSLSPTIASGLAIITAVKNRSEPLRFSIPTWLNQPSLKQLVIVDWDSDNLLMDELNSWDIPDWPDSRCLIVRVNSQPVWSMAKAINLAMQFVQYETVFKADADVLITDDIRTRLPQTNKCFVAGDWRQALSANDYHLHGSVAYKTSDFWRIGGYDERFDTYGSEDDDFYNRLEGAGLSRECFERKKIFHLPHSDRKRIENVNVATDDLQELIRESRIAASKRDLWTHHWPRATYHIVSKGLGSNHVILEPAQTALEIPPNISR